jgi:glycosyltransferase involved in cell wall biosynthesis
MPEVSVCIPAYGAAEFLMNTVDSVLSQDFEDFEVVITDDSLTLDVMEAIADVKDPRIRYVKNPHRLGSPANWAEGIGKSRGRLIKLMHHDDRFTRSDSLRRFVRLLDDPHVDFAFSASLVVDPEQEPLWVHSPTERIEEMRSNPYVLLLGNWVGGPSATIYRRTSGARIDHTLRWVVDIDLYLSVLVRNGAFSYEPEALVATTAGAPHQVTMAVQHEPSVALFEWFLLAAKWAPSPIWRDGELVRYLRSLQVQYDVRGWSDYRALGLSGRAARLFVLARFAGLFPASRR